MDNGLLGLLGFTTSNIEAIGQAVASDKLGGSGAVDETTFAGLLAQLTGENTSAKEVSIGHEDLSGSGTETAVQELLGLSETPTAESVAPDEDEDLSAQDGLPEQYASNSPLPEVEVVESAQQTTAPAIAAMLIEDGVAEGEKGTELSSTRNTPDSTSFTPAQVATVPATSQMPPSAIQQQEQSVQPTPAIPMPATETQTTVADVQHQTAQDDVSVSTTDSISGAAEAAKHSLQQQKMQRIDKLFTEAPQSSEVPETESVRPVVEKPEARTDFGRIYLGRRGDLVVLEGDRSKAPEPIGNSAENFSDGLEQIAIRDSQVNPPSLQAKRPEVVTGRFPQVLEDQIAKFSASTAEDGITKVIRVKLHPAELGEIRIELRMADGKVFGQIQAQHSATGDLISSNLNQLRTALEGQGVQVSNLAVSQGTISQFASDGFTERRPQYAGSKKDGHKGGSEDPELAKLEGYHPAHMGVNITSLNTGLDLRM